MAKYRVEPTGRERVFDRDEIIVSKTDLKGRITYANHVFIRVSGFSEEELLGRPHCIIRHPSMPRCVFKLLWDTIRSGQEIFAYVINMAKNGDHYWVLAHVTPTFDEDREIVGYHSNRRLPDPKAVSTITAIYEELLSIEESAADPDVGMEEASRHLGRLLESQDVTYGEFVFSI
ncbi:MAG TPA: PAS domain-containing protein [Planctomycetes bacterium]|nr:PAS domain-containing protein [Planctomycetota bacterium]